MKETIIKSVTAVICVIAVCVSSVLAIGKYGDAMVETAKHTPAAAFAMSLRILLLLFLQAPQQAAALRAVQQPIRRQHLTQPHPTQVQQTRRQHLTQAHRVRALRQALQQAVLPRQVAARQRQQIRRSIPRRR